VVDIQPEQPGDAQHIHALLRDAFPEPEEAELTDALREGGHLRLGCSRVARDGADIVGYAGIADVEVAAEPSLDVAVLAPVAVAPARQAEGIGTAVVQAAKRACVRRGCVAIVTEGDPDYYERFGFETAAEYGLESDLDPPVWAFQVCPCRPHALDGVSGTVRHPEPFHAL
jgi:putative acetyltransferase